MPNWKQIALARNLSMTNEEIECAAVVLESLETAFAPLRELIPFDSEPAVSYCVTRGGGAR